MKMKSTFIAATLLLVSVMTEGGLSAQNPIVQTCFTTDPAPMVHDGTLYVCIRDTMKTKRIFSGCRNGVCILPKIW